MPFFITIPRPPFPNYPGMFNTMEGNSTPPSSNWHHFSPYVQEQEGLARALNKEGDSMIKLHSLPSSVLVTIKNL